MKAQYTILPNRKKFVSNPAPLRIDERPVNLNARLLYQPSTLFTANSSPKRAAYAVSKRGFDISLSALFLVIALPLMAAIAVLIRATSKGPVFFRHRRLGRYGIEFDCLKFRTMVVDAEDILKGDPELHRKFREKFKIDGDPRVTVVGRFLRRTSLDELPQLFHVFTGKMSLIGPRPIVRAELEKYSIYRDKLLSVKPGLGGVWQTSGRSSTTYSERVLLDIFYVDHRCLLLDLQLLFLTILCVLRKSGAC